MQLKTIYLIRGENYVKDLDWSKEYELAKNGDPNDTQTAL